MMFCQYNVRAKRFFLCSEVVLAHHFMDSAENGVNKVRLQVYLFPRMHQLAFQVV